jgi:hypothetical protein
MSQVQALSCPSSAFDFMLVQIRTNEGGEG